MNERRVRPISPIDAVIAAHNLNMVEDISGRRVDATATMNMGDLTSRPLDPIDASIAAYNLEMIEDVRRGNSIYGRAADVGVIGAFLFFGVAILIQEIGLGWLLLGLAGICLPIGIPLSIYAMQKNKKNYRNLKTKRITKKEN